MHYPIQTPDQLKTMLSGLRKARGLSQADLAAKLGISQQAIAKFERNPAAASVERLFSVLRVMDARLALLDDEAAGPDASSASREAW